MPKYSLISQYESLVIAPNILEIILFTVNCKDCLSAELGLVVILAKLLNVITSIASIPRGFKLCAVVFQQEDIGLLFPSPLTDNAVWILTGFKGLLKSTNLLMFTSIKNTHYELLIPVLYVSVIACLSIICTGVAVGASALRDHNLAIS